MQTNIQIIMIFSGKDNHVWPFLSLCSLTNVLSLGKHDKWFCPNFNNHLAKTKLVLHCNGPNFGQKPIEIFRCRLYSARVLKSQHHSPPVTAMPLTSLSSLLHSWELNTYLYVMSNTLYKDYGVFLFFSFSILYHHSQQPVSEPPMYRGQFLLSQRHSLYLRITCTRGQQQKEW